jgi:PilZ domain
MSAPGRSMKSVRWVRIVKNFCSDECVLSVRRNSVEHWEVIDGGTPRAPRYALYLPLRYRLRRELGWHRGVTMNISRSGLLFRAEELIPPQSKIEVRLQLELENPVEIVCSAEIVRGIPPDVQGGTMLGATIAKFAFSRLENTASAQVP